MLGKFNEVRVDTTRNLGNYENEKVGLSYAPTEEENIFEVIAELKLITSGKQIEVKEVSAPVKSLTKTKPAPAKAEAKEETKAEVKEEVKEETKAEVKEEVKEETKAETVKTEKKPRVTKPKTGVNTVYDRMSDIHKKELAKFLNSSLPGWNKGENLKKASAVSQALSGTEDFLDANGILLESFVNKFTEMFLGN